LFAIGLGLLETAIANLAVGPVELGPGFAQVVPLGLAVLLLNLWTRRAALQETA
jgi:hypothetical protein